MTDTLREAGTLGAWLESRLHLTLTQIADDLFGDGFVTREERITLSGAIGDALTTYNERIMADAPQLYQRDRWEMGEASTTLVGDLVPLEEAVGSDGALPIIKLIQPGWGSSGFYSPDVLRRDGPTVFTPGMKMYWDHPTNTEEAERPERSLRDLAAELVSGAEWQENGPRGPGLYARAQVFAPYRDAVKELAPHIGVSIRAMGRARHGEAEGRQGPIIEQIVAGKSVDFVTVAGAGGEIVGLFEAARTRGPQIQHEQQEVVMADVDLQTVQAENESLKESIARLSEMLMFREAGDVVTEVLRTVEMPEATRARLSRDMAKKPVVVDGKLDRDGFKAVILEAAKAEMEYLTQAGLGSSPVHGMGASESSTDQGQAKLASAMQRLGLSEAAAKVAAQGR